MKTTRKQIGILTIEENETRTTSNYECAAWYMKMNLVAGQYPVYGNVDNVTGKVEDNYVICKVPAIVVADNFDSLYCGTVIAPHRNEHVNESTQWTWERYAHAIACDLVEGRTVVTKGFELLPSFEAVLVPFEYQGEQHHAYNIVEVK